MKKKLCKHEKTRYNSIQTMYLSRKNIGKILNFG